MNTRNLLSILLCAFFLTGCYTQLKLSGDNAERRHRPQSCYYERERVSVDLRFGERGYITAYRRVCPGDPLYFHQKWDRERYHYGHRSYDYYDHEYEDEDDDRTHRPRGSTVGRGVDRNERENRRRSSRRSGDRDGSRDSTSRERN